MELLIIITTLLLSSSIDARILQNDSNVQSISNEIPKEVFRNKEMTRGRQAIPSPQVASTGGGFQSITSSPIIQAMLSNITVQTVLSDPLVQSVLSNPTVQSVLTNPIVQAILFNPALQGLALQAFLTDYPSAMNPPVSTTSSTTTTTPFPLIFPSFPPTTAQTPINPPQRPTITIVGSILTALDEIINILQAQNNRRLRQRQKLRN